MADPGNDLQDPSYLVGRVLALESDLARERERADLMVMAARGLRDEVRELRLEVVRQGGMLGRTYQIVEALARHLGIDPDSLAPLPDVPFAQRTSRVDHAIDALEARATRNDPEELQRGRTPPQAPPVVEAAPPSEEPEHKHHHKHKRREQPSSMPLNPSKSWRPSSVKGWAQLIGAFMLAVVALAGAARELVTSLRTPPAAPARP